MEKITKIFALLLVFLVVFTTSCNKDDDGGSATPAQAEAAIEEIGLQMTTDIENLMASDGGVALASLMDLNAPFFGNIPLKSIKDIKNFAKVEEVDHGTYTWDPDYYGVGYGEWTYESLPADKLIMLFPTTDSPSNNAELTITEFEFVQVGIDEVPTSLALGIKVDNVTQVTIDLTATWLDAETPSSLMIDIFLNPYTISGSWTLSTNSATVSVSITEGTTTIIGASLTATFSGTPMDTSPSNIEGHIQMRTLQLQGNMQMAAMEDLLNATEGDASADQLNALFNLSFVDLSTGNNLGSFMVIDDYFGYTELVFVYPDGTVADDAYTTQITELIQEMF